MHQFPNLVSVACIKCQSNVLLESQRTASDRVGSVSDSERLMRITSGFLCYVSYDVSCSWLIPLVYSPSFTRVGQFSRSIDSGMLTSFPIPRTSVRCIVIIATFSIRDPPMRAGVELAVSLQNVTSRNVRPLVIM